MLGAMAEFPARRWPWIAAAILVIVNLLWTGGLALSHDKALNDRLGYYLVAETMASGDTIATTAKPDPRATDIEPPYAVGERPLYPFLVSLVFRLAGPSVQAGNLVSALMRAFALLPIFALALTLFGPWAALVTGLLYTLSPPWTGLGATSMTDTTFAFFMYLALWAFVLHWRRSSLPAVILAGAAVALTTLTREEGLILGVFLAAVLLVRRQYVSLAAFLAIPVILLGAWQVYLYRTFGSLFYTPRSVLFVAHYEHLFALALPSRHDYLASVGGWAGAANVRLFNYIGYVRNLLADGLIVDTGQAGIFPITFVLPLGILGWTLLRRLRAGEEQVHLALLLALTVAIQAIGALTYIGLPLAMVGEIRQIQSVTPVLLILAAAGLVWLWNRSSLGRGLAILLAVHFFVFSGLYHFLLIDVLIVEPPYNSTDIQALRQVAPDLDPEAILMSRKPNRASYYTDHPAVIMPLAGFHDLMAYAHAHDVTHIVVTPRELQTRPGLGEGLAWLGSSVELRVAVGDTQIFEVHDYEFLSAIEQGGPLDQGIDLAAPMPPPDWSELLRRATPSTLDQVRNTWQQWLEVAP